jgi:hypothetical protein
MTVFWVVAPCSLVEVYRRFGGALCLHHQGEESYTLLQGFSTRGPLMCFVRPTCGFYNAYCVNLYDDKYFPVIRKHALLMPALCCNYRDEQFSA